MLRYRLLNCCPHVALLTADPNYSGPIYRALRDLGASVTVFHGGGVQPEILAEYDLGVAWRCRWKLGRNHLAVLPVVNIHPGMLPMCRGAHPLYWGLREKPVNPGVTLHWMDEGIDTGAVIDQHYLPFTSKTLRELHDDAEMAGAGMLRQHWRRILSLEPGLPQSGPSSCHKAAELPKLEKGWDTPCMKIATEGPPADDAGFIGSGS